MANEKKAPVRGVQLLKTEVDGSTLLVFDRRDGAFVTAVNVAKLTETALHRAAIHGLTQNLLDSSNKLEGDARIAHIKTQAAIVQDGGWASAPTEVNIDAAKAKMVAALVAMGKTPEEASSMVAGLGV